MAVHPNNAQLPVLQEAFRWFGPNDSVPLSYIRQAGAHGVYTSLHDIPYGEVWPRSAIAERKKILEEAGLQWLAVESLPVHEDIKTGKDERAGGRRQEFLENYRQSLKNLADEGVRVVIYNFMPVLDWVRTDLNYVLPDGSIALRYDPVRFAAFDVFALQRLGAKKDYTAEQLSKAEKFWQSLKTDDERTAFINTIIDVFPGCKWGLSLDDIRAMLARYEGLDRKALKANLKYFLAEVIPTAEEVGVRLAIHPDDPPFPVLGLARIFSTQEDINDLMAMNPSLHNGVNFCTGSFSGRLDNDLPAMIASCAPRIHAVHLRMTKHEPDGSFYEDNHLEGSMDMFACVSAFVSEQERRMKEGKNDWSLSFRPDHGHTMMDDLHKPPTANPGYSAIGRMRGLSELRGLQLGIARMKAERH
jgi:mannonate dehydratase